MVNFKCLVENTLAIQEAENISPQAVNPPSKEDPVEVKKTLQEFIKEALPINPLRNLFTSYFSTEEFNYDQNIADPTQFTKILEKAHYIIPRPTGAETAFKGVEKATPMIDFLIYFTDKIHPEEEFKAKSKAAILKPNIQFSLIKLTQIANNFVDEFDNYNKTKGQDSFKNYKPITDTVRELHAKYFGQKGDELIGKLALNNYNKASIKKTIYGLLEVRKQIRSKQIKDEDIPNAIEWIDDILINPQKYAGAQTLVPAKFKKMYQDVHATKLVEISDAALKLFESEANRNGISAQISEVFPNKVLTTFNEFLSNKTSPTSTQEKNTFVFRFGEKENKDEETDERLIGEKAVEDLPEGYTIENIKNILKTIPESRTQADTLIKRLEAFANYIREEVGPDIVGGLNDMAQMFKAISSGVPSMGSR